MATAEQAATAERGYSQAERKEFDANEDVKSAEAAKSAALNKKIAADRAVAEDEEQVSHLTKLSQSTDDEMKLMSSEAALAKKQEGITKDKEKATALQQEEKGTQSKLEVLKASLRKTKML
jgi:hypothetical protein